MKISIGMYALHVNTKSGQELKLLECCLSEQVDEYFK